MNRLNGWLMYKVLYSHREKSKKIQQIKHLFANPNFLRSKVKIPMDLLGLSNLKPSKSKNFFLPFSGLKWCLGSFLECLVNQKYGVTRIFWGLGWFCTPAWRWMSFWQKNYSVLNFYFPSSWKKHDAHLHQVF